MLKKSWSSPLILKWLPKFINKGSPLSKDWLRKEDIYLQKNIRKGTLVLDVGCGLGRSAKSIRNIAKKITGIDHTLMVVKRARKLLAKFKNIEVLEAEAEKMPFRDNAFDYVICMMNTFGDSPNLKIKILKEMKRVAKKGGKIIISVWSERALPTRLKDYIKIGFQIKKITKEGLIYTADGPTEQFSKEKLKKIFDRVGLILKIKELNPISYICVATKK